MLYSRNKQPKPRRFFRPLPLIAAGIFIIAAGTLAVLELTGTTHIIRAKPVVKTATISATTEQPTGNSATDKATPSTPTPEPEPIVSDKEKGNGDAPAQPVTPSGAAPDTPSGTFVSNHTPSLSNTELSKMDSECTTTAGATCAITFTKGDLTRTLPEQTTNGDGKAFWKWNVKEANFTEGDWTVTVTARLNGQTRSAHDTLKVGP